MAATFLDFYLAYRISYIWPEFKFYIPDYPEFLKGFHFNIHLRIYYNLNYFYAIWTETILCLSQYTAWDRHNKAVLHAKLNNEDNCTIFYAKLKAKKDFRNKIYIISIVQINMKCFVLSYLIYFENSDFDYIFKYDFIKII